MLTDIEIAQACAMKPIGEVAASLGISEEYIEPYGRYKAKISPAAWESTLSGNGKLVLVTAINPTPAGEGKTTTTIGLADGLCSCRRAPRAVARTRVRHKGRRRGRRVCAGGPDGGYKSAFHR